MALFTLQVPSSKYVFSDYYTDQRWRSLWHQAHLVSELHPSSVLEIGPAKGVLKAVLGCFGVTVKTVDIDPDLHPDLIASAHDLPLQDAEFDCVCAFQVLEHLPYEEAMAAFGELVRVAKRHVIISLPDALRVWNYVFHIPGYGDVALHLPRPRFALKKHVFDGEHHWELNKSGYVEKDVRKDFCRQGVRVLKNYKLTDYPFHRYYLFEKSGRQERD